MIYTIYIYNEFKSLRFKYFDLHLVVPNILMSSSGGISNLDHNSKHEKVDENYVH